VLVEGWTVEEKAERKSEFNPSGNSAWKDHIPIRVLCNPSAEVFFRALRADGAFGVIRHLPDDFVRDAWVHVTSIAGH
jgi:hypothetical protein